MKMNISRNRHIGKLNRVPQLYNVFYFKAVVVYMEKLNGELIEPIVDDIVQALQGNKYRKKTVNTFLLWFLNRYISRIMLIVYALI